MACQPPRKRVVAMTPSCGREVCNATIYLKNDILGVPLEARFPISVAHA